MIVLLYVRRNLPFFTVVVKIKIVRGNPLPFFNLCRHLSGNHIGNLCGLESARYLEELHVAKQRLPHGQRFTIDRASIDGIKARRASTLSKY